MYDRVVVATADEVFGDGFGAVADKVADEMARGSSRETAMSVKRLRALLARRAAGPGDLFIIDLSLPEGGGATTDGFGAAFALAAELQDGADPPATILLAALAAPELRKRVDVMPRCRVFEVPDAATDFFHAVALARALARLPAAGRAAAPEPKAARKRYALLDLDVRAGGEVRATLKLRGEDRDDSRDRTATFRIDPDRLKELAARSSALRDEFSAKLERGAEWSAYVDLWHARYQELGTAVSNLLDTSQFAALYALAEDRAGKNARVRFNLDGESFGVCWEAAFKGTSWMAVDTTVIRRVSDADGRSEAQLDGGDGRLDVLVVESDPAPDARYDGPQDAQWRAEWKEKARRGFPRVPGLPQERAVFEKLDGRPNFSARILRSQDRAGRFDLRQELRDELLSPRDRPYDVVHFAGHAICPDTGPDARGYLVLAGRPNNYALPIGVFAEWLAEAGVRLAYLSCCRSAAPRATFELARKRIPLALGFSWDLDGGGAAEFAEEFYGRLLDNDLRVCRAFQETKAALHDLHRTGSPIWASPVLVTQPMEWLDVERCLGAVS
ncbi:CHAT domain-containing protein [Sphingomonas sp. IW22]|uniref:CHAT domain-containing protein n=1 Tax=Sphingomonas sp. IW22 TaxID=3242489 RepID=UPI0035221D3A